jgi:uncharacterized protein (DUF58 family)
MLFDLKFFKSLRLLRIITRRHFRGEKIGHRKSPNRGASAEFAEYKEYFPGDEIRFIDWNLYGRLEKLYIKRFHNEENLAVSILLDCSTSMSFGSPSKFDHARKLAAAISYIALQQNDVARIYPFSQSLEGVSEGGFRRGHIHRLMGFLENRQPSGKAGAFDEIVQHFLMKNKRPGVVFILSDGLFGESLYAGLKRLNHRKFEVNMVQILAPEEMNPDVAGFMDLVDSEELSKVSLQVNKQALFVYQEVLKEMLDEQKSFLVQQGMKYFKSLTNTPFESTLLHLFRLGESAE